LQKKLLEASRTEEKARAAVVKAEGAVQSAEEAIEKTRVAVQELEGDERLAKQAHEVARGAVKELEREMASVEARRTESVAQKELESGVDKALGELVARSDRGISPKPHTLSE
jgi:chromosome segregation ATPase